MQPIGRIHLICLWFQKNYYLLLTIIRFLMHSAYKIYIFNFKDIQKTLNLSQNRFYLFIFTLIQLFPVLYVTLYVLYYMYV